MWSCTERGRSYLCAHSGAKPSPACGVNYNMTRNYPKKVAEHTHNFSLHLAIKLGSCHANGPQIRGPSGDSRR